MHKDSERILAIKERIAAKRAKLESLPAIQRLTAAIKADEAIVEKMEVDQAKRLADQRRRDDVKAKILIGAGVSLLPTAPFARTIHEVTAVLAKRDQEWLDRWLRERNIDLSVSATAAAEFTSPVATQPSDPIGNILKRAFADLGTGFYELFSSEILGRVDEQDRTTLQNWLSTLTQARQ